MNHEPDTRIAQLKDFISSHEPAVVINLTTNQALLCMRAEFEAFDGKVLLKFESLRDHGSSIVVTELQEVGPEAISIENDEGNVLRIEPLGLANYKHYIQPQYTNTPDFTDLDKLKAYIHSQVTQHG